MGVQPQQKGGRVKLSDVAAAAGVHPATVSHVLSNRPEARIAEDTRTRVLEAATKLGYAPNQAARALARGSTQTAALLTFDFRSPYAAEITEHLQSIAFKDGFNIIATIVHRDLGGLSTQVDGCIALDYSPLFPPPVGAGAYVALGVYAPEDSDSCLFDFDEAGREALESLVAQGCRRFVYLTGADPLHNIDPRQKIFLEVVRGAGLTPRVVEAPLNDRESALAAALELLRGDRPDVIFCRNESMAIGCLKALSESGIQTPSQVKVLGCDGTGEGRFYSPALSTLALPLRAATEAAWGFFLNRLEDPSLPIQTSLHPAVYERRGTT